jgi:hypothetical protein
MEYDYIQCNHYWSRSRRGVLDSSVFSRSTAGWTKTGCCHYEGNGNYNV